jgi:hypothetical protein
MKVLALALATALLLLADSIALAQRPAGLAASYKARRHSANMERPTNTLDWRTERYSYFSEYQAGDQLNGLTVWASLSEDDRDRAKVTPVNAVYVLDGAPTSLFEDPTIFRNLRGAILKSTSNSSHLRQLAKSYPSLKLLVIQQGEPLSDQDLSIIQSFRGLDSLELECPILEGRQIGNSLPSGLRMLHIESSNMLEVEPETPLNLPDLRELRITNCSLSASFFSKLNCPRLEWISIANVSVTGRSLGRTQRFPALRRVDILHTQMSTNILAEIECLPDLRISKMTSSKVYGAETCWTEGLLLKP